MSRVRRRLRPVLAALTAAAAAAAVPATAGLAGTDGGGGQLLPAGEAFVLGAERRADDTLVLHWTIAEDYYLYRDRVELALRDGGDARLGTPRFAPARTKADPFFGEVAVYYDDAAVRVPLAGDPADGARLHVTYQGCNEPIGVCYSPIERTLALASLGPATAGGPGGEQGRIAAALADRALWLTAAAFVGFGLLLALTPCVFPMIPILAGVVAGDARGGRAARAATLSGVFVVAMALTYAALGVAIGLTGAQLQAWFQQPAVIAAVAAAFVALALAMFGLFELQAPRGLRAAVEARTRRLGGSVAGAGAFGVISALVVGPCVTPPLVGALLYVARTGDPTTGGVALFALGIGMGIPLIVAGACAGHVLPRAGPWMHRVRAAFGVLLLGVAIWLLQRVIPVSAAMALWAVLAIVCGVQLGALGAAADAWQRLWKGVGAVLVLYGAILLVGAAGGGQSVLQPLRGVLGGGPAATTAAPDFRAVSGAGELRRLLGRASAAGRPVMLDVYADWCVACNELEAYTFPDPRVQRALGDTMLLRADVTANDAGDRRLLQRFDLYGPPAVLFFGPDGVERRGYRVVGFKGPEAFAAHARRALAADGGTS